MLKNLNRRATLSLLGLEGLFFLFCLVSCGLAILGLGEIFWVIAAISGGLFVLFGVVLIVTWLVGARQARQAQAFLESERPFVRWTYSTFEWQAVKEAEWQEERGDWKIQLGCLTAIFALAGLLTGVLIGAEEGVLEAVTSGVIGIFFGAAFGGGIGAAVAAGNYLAARQAYLDPEPGQVALGRDELYANSSYFKGNGVSSYIQDIRLEPGSPDILQIQVRVPPRPRAADIEEWQIVVPFRMLRDVEDALPLLKKGIE